MPNSSRIYLPSPGADAWIGKLAAGRTHWKRGCSAYELAVSWELAALRPNSNGLPPCVSGALTAGNAFTSPGLLFALPEHQVQLQGVGSASVTDLWALVGTDVGPVSLAVEGKASESFDVLVEKWRVSSGSGNNQNREARLEFLRALLDLAPDRLNALHYQLLHRAASAILEAKRLGAEQAVLLVQSFARCPQNLRAFERFGAALGVQVPPKGLVFAGTRSGVHLWLGWTECPPASGEEINALVQAGRLSREAAQMDGLNS